MDNVSKVPVTYQTIGSSELGRRTDTETVSSGAESMKKLVQPEGERG